MGLFFMFLFYLNGFSQGHPSENQNSLRWDSEKWEQQCSSGSSVSISGFPGIHSDGLKCEYSIPSADGYFSVIVTPEEIFSFDNPVVFYIKVDSLVENNTIELKFIDQDGSVYGRKARLCDFSGAWKQVVVYLKDTEYWWGGDATFDKFADFSIAVSGRGTGTLLLDEIEFGKQDLLSIFKCSLDPDSSLTGIGFIQRRDLSLIKEDPLMLFYLKTIQDTFAPGKNLLPSMEGYMNELQTFNNSLVAIAFVLKGEKKRAERILDWFAEATDTANMDKYKQNFYYNHEARGFYQKVNISTYKADTTVDRWMGDMAWLLIACKNYEFRFSSQRYDHLIGIIKNLLISFYKPAEKGGYIQSGWRHGDVRLHEAQGHPEGNIDCYVAFKLCGEEYYAENIRIWIENELYGRPSLPLDLYTWRVLAFGRNYASLLNIPEYDFRYRKILDVNGDKVMGFYHCADIYVNNFWNDGTGHIACAYQTFGDKQRGYFYANQMDYLIINSTVGKAKTHTIPYTLNNEGGYEWVNTNRGFISCVAWYIFAKNGFNPFLSQNFDRVLVPEN